MKRSSANAAQASFDFAEVTTAKPIASPSPAGGRIVKMFGAMSHTGRYHNFSMSDWIVRLCEQKEPLALDVQILDAPSEGCYFAWETKENALICISPTRQSLLTSLPDGFSKLLASGRGQIVPISIREQL